MYLNVKYTEIFVLASSIMMTKNNLVKYNLFCTIALVDAMSTLDIFSQVLSSCLIYFPLKTFDCGGLYPGVQKTFLKS